MSALSSLAVATCRAGAPDAKHAARHRPAASNRSTARQVRLSAFPRGSVRHFGLFREYESWPLGRKRRCFRLPGVQSGSSITPCAPLARIKDAHRGSGAPMRDASFLRRRAVRPPDKSAAPRISSRIHAHFDLFCETNPAHWTESGVCFRLPGVQSGSSITPCAPFARIKDAHQCSGAPMRAASFLHAAIATRALAMR